MHGVNDFLSSAEDYRLKVFAWRFLLCSINHFTTDEKSPIVICEMTFGLYLFGTSFSRLVELKMHQHCNLHLNALSD
jgi:hypothetical protein